MPSIRYINQSAPFWDFIANLEEQGSQHPFFGGASRGDGPPAWGWGGPQHWHRGPPPHHHRGDAGEGPSTQNPPPPPPEGATPPPPAGPEGHPSPPPAGAEHDGPFAHRPHPHHRRGGCHGRRGRGGFGGPWGAHGFGGGLGGLEAFLNAQLFGGEDSSSPNETSSSPNNDAARASEDFKPDADVFDTESAFIIHISLPGAKKEDVGVNWDAEKSELSVAGVVYRPGDEDFLKTLALDERKVGAFEKKIRLGTRANAAQVDADAISAKLEDGVLRVEVPKLDRDYVEIKKVDIE